MQTFIKKITSRKFLTCIAGVVLGISMIFGLDEGAISTIAGAITSIASLVSYIISEGKVDAAAVNNEVEIITDAVDVIEDIKE